MIPSSPRAQAMQNAQPLCSFVIEVPALGRSRNSTKGRFISPNNGNARRIYCTFELYDRVIMGKMDQIGLVEALYNLFGKE